MADDLGAWLVAVLADAGRRRLAGLVLGSDQERALRLAAAAALRLTAGELYSGDEERAGGGGAGGRRGVPGAGAGRAAGQA